MKNAKRRMIAVAATVAVLAPASATAAQALVLPDGFGSGFNKGSDTLVPPTMDNPPATKDSAVDKPSRDEDKVWEPTLPENKTPFVVIPDASIVLPDENTSSDEKPSRDEDKVWEPTLPENKTPFVVIPDASIVFPDEDTSQQDPSADTVETVAIVVDGVTRTVSTAPTMTTAGTYNDWIQSVGMPAQGCEALSTTMVHGVASDWVATWGEWLNDGEGGLACERVLTYTDGKWIPVDVDAAFTVERTKTGALKITDYAPQNHRIGSTPAPVLVEKVAKDGGVKINKPTMEKITEAYDKAQEIANKAKHAADKVEGLLSSLR